MYLATILRLCPQNALRSQIDIERGIDDYGRFSSELKRERCEVLRGCYRN
jgi:hypothetical protein